MTRAEILGDDPPGIFDFSACIDGCEDYFGYAQLVELLTEDGE